jgi:hypothetical protein
MKSVSAAIIALAGSVIYAGGVTVSHSDTQVATCLIGGMIGIVGLWAWAITFFRTPE